MHFGILGIYTKDSAGKLSRTPKCQNPKSKINIDLVAHFFGSEPERVFALPDLELLFIEKFDD
jgi:hypothetical protein